ncbi:MAG TPA: VWA domain-containing protein, partial [Chloroflexota bacterium]
TVPTPATLRLYRDEDLLLERQVELRGGSQEVVLPVPVGEPGLHRYRLDVAPGAPGVDSTTVNNALGAIQQVVGPPRALIVATDPALAGFLPDALRAAGAEVEVVPPAGVPADLAGWAQYDVAVLADVPVEALPPGVMETVERFVRDLGRGLVMTGGPSSFGPGGYADTPVERALPVYMDLRGRGRQPRVALVLVVDKSGSMAGTKMELAKEAAARSIRLLRPGDQAAVVAFDSVPQWVAPLTPVSELARLEQAVGSIYAGGGTEIYPALVAGFEGLRQADADVKHVILLTDGRSGSSGEYLELLQRMREERVTLSTVAVGTDADTGLLEAMARVGRGRYHFAASPEDIPEIFARETIMATRTILVDLEFFPSVASPGPLLQGLTAVPPLRGYVAVTPKERAEVLLVSPENDPVLAAWQYGAGRAVAWTPDVGGRWSEAWASSPAATILWGNVLSWLLPPRDGGELSVRVEAENERAFAVIAENRGNWDEVRPTRATLLGPDRQRQEVDLVPAGPGRYRGVVAPPEPGAYVVQVTQVAGDGVELRGEAGWVAPYPAEFRATGVDGALLAQVAAAGGGRVLTDPVEGVQPAQRSAVARWPLWPLLLTLAALLWPLEIAARRLALPPLAARLPLPRRAAAPRAEAGELSPSSDGVATPPSPAAATTQRLLQRKRELRDERRQRAR